MSLYGGMTYPGTSFVFDKIYENEDAAKEGLKNDGILIGRYVLNNDTKDVYRVAYNGKNYYYQTITNLKVSGVVNSYWQIF